MVNENVDIKFRVIDMFKLYMTIADVGTAV
jgi:hypothetical protein